MPASERTLQLLRVLSPLLLVGLWQVVVTLFSPPMLPGPVDVLRRLGAEIAAGELLFHMGATLARVAVSFLIAMLLGLILGALMGKVKAVDAAFDGLLTVGLNIPALVVMILCFMWFGLNEATIILAVVLNKTPTMAVVFREGVRAVDPMLLEVGLVHRLNYWKILRKIWLPQLYPYFLAATRTGLALVWKIVLVVELLGASRGMGFKLGEYFQFFEVDAVLAYALAFVAVIMLLEGFIVRPWEREVLRWRVQT